MKTYTIKTDEDIRFFLEKTNFLHDGYLIGVEYVNGAVLNVDENGCCVYPDDKKLLLRFLVTSIWNTVVELEFDAVREWKLEEAGWEFLDTSVHFEGEEIFWLDGEYIDRKHMEDSCYVIAKSMKWRIVEQKGA